MSERKPKFIYSFIWLYASLIRHGSFEVTELSILVISGCHHKRLRAASLTSQKGPCIQKKNNLCYVTHWCCCCCCCCLWQWSRRRKPEGGGSDARWKWLGQRVEGKGEEKREEVVLDDSLLPTSCTVTISVLCVLSSRSPFTVTPRPHSLQQHDITDYSHHLIKPHWWKWCSCFSDSYTYACSCSPAPLWLGFMCLMCRCYF